MKHRVTSGAPAAIAAGALFFLVAFAAPAKGETLSLTFDQARISIGPLEAADVAPAGGEPAAVTATWDPATGAFSAPASAVRLPSFTLEDVDLSAAGIPGTADVRASLTAIGTTTGTFDGATGALATSHLDVRARLSVVVGGFITVGSCTIEPIPVPLATSGELGDSGYTGDPLDPGGAAVAEWGSLPAATGSGAIASYCSQADAFVGGPGGVWLGGRRDGLTPSQPAAGGTPAGTPAAPPAGPRGCAKAKKKKGKGKKKRCGTRRKRR